MTPSTITSANTFASPPRQLTRVMFLYWGRRGAMPQFTLELGRAALANPTLAPTICVSRHNELFAAYDELGAAVLPVTTFHSHLGALTQIWRLPVICRRLASYIRHHQIEAVVDLMPHVWSPLIVSTVQASGARYVPILHDAVPHPGDPTTWVKRLIDRSLQPADTIITLSASVTKSLQASAKRLNGNVVTLFHPDFAFAPRQPRTLPGTDAPWRLLFLGRIMPYKGLPLFLDTVEHLRNAGVAVQAGVFGEGDVAGVKTRLTQNQIEIVNRWLSEAEIGAVLNRYDAVVLSHIEASQSGVAAAAFGAGVPVVATPIGGLREQITDGVTGTLATRIDAPALAEAISHLFCQPGLYASVCANIEAQREHRSMGRFVKACVEAAVPARSATG